MSERFPIAWRKFISGPPHRLIASHYRASAKRSGPSPPPQNTQELAAILASGQNGTMPLAILVAETTGGSLAGFLEVGLRSHADGCDSKTPVAFLEGWYVAEAFRKKGVGKQLLFAAENWARRQGCVELASDTWIDHITSQRVHEALGFEVVDRCVHYRKSLR